MCAAAIVSRILCEKAAWGDTTVRPGPQVLLGWQGSRGAMSVCVVVVLVGVPCALDRAWCILSAEVENERATRDRF